MSYPEIHIPIKKNIYDLTPKEAKIFNEWFIANLEKRVKTLELSVRLDEKQRFWRADYTPDSLIKLGEWLNDNLVVLDQTHLGIEKDIMKNRYPEWFADIVREISGNKKFSDETYRMCFDVGIYFGETLRNVIPSLRWDYKISNSFVHKNQPIIVKDKNKSSLNPRSIVEGIASKFIRGESKPEQLKAIFEVWVEIFNKN